MLDAVQAGACSENPASEQSRWLALDTDFIHFQKSRGVRRFRCRTRVAGTGCELKRAELNGFINADFKETIRPVILSRPLKTAIGFLIGCCAMATGDATPKQTIAAMNMAGARERSGCLRAFMIVRIRGFRAWDAARSIAGNPRLVITCGWWAMSRGQSRALRTICCGRTSEIGLMRQLPFLRHVVFLARGYVDRIMQPAVPAGRNGRGLGIAIIDHPAALDADGRIYFAATRAIIAIAVLIFTHEFAMKARGPQGAEGCAVPPGKDAQQEIFHWLVPIATFHAGLHPTVAPAMGDLYLMQLPSHDVRSSHEER